MADDQLSRDRFKIMERKLFNGIMTPSAVVVLITGIWLLSYGFWGNWMIAKLSLVAATLVYHAWCGYSIKVFRDDRNTRSHAFYRIMNEVPVFMMIPIVILVVVKPF